MLWIKALHIVFVVAWFAGLFYLPRLFVYHAMADDSPSRERFKVMERKLYRGIMTPAMVLTLATGIWMWWRYGFQGGWLYAKVALVVLLVVYHFWMRALMVGSVCPPVIGFAYSRRIPSYGSVSSSAVISSIVLSTSRNL